MQSVPKALSQSLCVLGLGLGLLAGLPHAALAQGLVAGNNPSLILLIWDPVNKVSYSRDTGLLGATLYNGQVDAGMQKFWTLDPTTDSNFAQFQQASPNLAQDQWMVIGGGKAATGVTAGAFTVFTTMINTVLVDGQPILNPEWDNMTAMTNNNLRSEAQAFQSAIYAPLNSAAAPAGINPANSYATAPAGQGSSFDTTNSNGYLGAMQPVLSDSGSGLGAGEALFGGLGGQGGLDAANPIGSAGSSSWFLYMTNSNPTARDPMLQSPMTVSAFSNSAQDAYWGLAPTLGASGQKDLVLSFTLPAAITAPATAEGVLRRSQTDYTAQFGSALLIDKPSQQFANWTPSVLLAEVSAVPEPDSLLLMSLGLGGVLLAAARRKRAAAA